MAGVPARVVAGLVVALALVSGVLLGIASDRLLLLPAARHRGGVAMRGPSAGAMLFGPPPDAGRGQGRPFEPSAEWVTDRLARELDLTAGQRARVDSIVTRRMAERRELMAPVRDRMRQLFDSTRTDVEAVLTPAQRTRLDSMRTRREGRDGPSPPPAGN